MGARLRCASLDHPHDLRQQGFAAYALGAHQQPAGAVDGRADDAVAGMFLDGDRLAGDHRFVDGTQAFEDHAVDGNLFAGSDAQLVADLDLIERDVVFAAVRRA